MQGVIFDLWGTLVDGGVRSPIHATHDVIAPSMDFSEFVEKFERATMTKKFASQKEMFGSAAKELNIPISDYNVEKLIGIWNRNALLARTFNDTIPTLEELKKKGTELVLISNTPCFLTEEAVDKLELRKFFDMIVFSCNEGLLKTDKEFIEIILKKTGLNKDQIVLIGDSIATDMACAEKAGIKGLLLDRRWRHPYKNRIKMLTEALTL